MNEKEHLLTCLSEESAEVIQIVSKIQRFGMDNYNPETKIINRAALIKEITDVFAVLQLLNEFDVIGIVIEKIEIEKKKEKVRRYMNCAREEGTLT